MFLPELLEVLAITGTRVSSITAFCDPGGCESAGGARREIALLFERRGLPPSLVA
jgi:hypothetical protein